MMNGGAHILLHAMWKEMVMGSMAINFLYHIIDSDDSMSTMWYVLRSDSSELLRALFFLLQKSEASENENKHGKKKKNWRPCQEFLGLLGARG